ncbi:MAG: energy transducer TonB [Cycloclasticus sp. symbiont of Poecilosclerida sp. M]|nr:MAG: energy transducer TonB [Cycloclasticus sp. symbiont of Poecilosclerida sp. M]
MQTAAVTSADKFGVTFFAASVLHAVIILGVGFDVDVNRYVGRPLEIALVKAPDTERPDEADFLAQEDQMGSGEAEEKALNRRQASRMLSEKEPVVSDAKKVQKAKASADKMLVQKKAQLAVEVSNQPVPDKHKTLSAAKLLEQNEEILRLQAEIAQSIDSSSKRPRKLHVNSISAHKSKAASYEAAWQQKVERVGNLNYPGEVRRKQLSGTLLLSVEINQDGSLKKVIIKRRSGHKIIDDAAINIIKLSAPFAPFPTELRNEVDILVIVRTWQFLNEGYMRTK